MSLFNNKGRKLSFKSKKKSPSSKVSAGSLKSKTTKLTYKRKVNYWNIFEKALNSKEFQDWLKCLWGASFMAFCLPSSSNEYVEILKSFCAFFAFSPFLLSLIKSKDVYDALLKGFFGGMIFNIIGFRFLWGIHPLSWLGVPDDLSLLASFIAILWASFQQSVYWAIFAGLFKLIQNNKGFTVSTVLASCLIWIVLLEKLANSSLMAGIPWNLLYYSQHANLLLIQISELMGASAVTFIVLLSNFTIAGWMLNSQRDINHLHFIGNARADIARASTILFSLTIILICGAFCFGYFKKFVFPPLNLKGNAIKVALLQKNIPVNETRFNSSNSENNYLAYSFLINRFREEVNLIVMPEGAVPQRFIKRITSSYFTEQGTTNLILGSYLSDDLSNYFNAAVAIKSLNQSDDGYCPILKNKKLTSPDFYFKQVLVPFGEYTPFEGIVRSLLKKLELENLAESGFQRGKKSGNFEFTFGQIGPLICFEMFFSDLFHQQVQAGAQGIVVVGDASWFHGQTKLVNQNMLAVAKFRAIESRKQIITSVNQGPLALINEYGEIKSIENKKDSLVVPFKLNSERTFFTKAQFL
jgi:apolipoprotein N-acyltransferase